MQVWGGGRDSGRRVQLVQYWLHWTGTGGALLISKLLMQNKVDRNKQDLKKTLFNTTKYNIQYLFFIYLFFKSRTRQSYRYK